MKLETIISRRLFTGARRIAAGAAAMLLLAGGLPAWAATATLNGVTTNTCTYTASAIDASGNIAVTCNNTPSAGQIAFAQTSYSADINNASFQVNVNRNSGSSGAVGATVTAGGGCTVAGGASTTVSFGDGLSTPVALVVGTPPTPTTCTLTLSAATGTPAPTLGGPASINVTDPTLPGTFSFQSPTSTATTGISNHSVTILRTGGTAGTYDVVWEAAVTGLTGQSASPNPVRFGPGETTKSITLTTGSTPGTVAFAIGTAAAPVVPVAPTVTATTASGTHTVTVSQPTGCPTPGTNVTVLNAPTIASPTAQRYAVSGPVGQIISIPAPATTFRIRTFDTVSTPASGFGTSFGLVRCPADTPSGQQTGPVPCKKQGGWSGNTLDIASTQVLFPPNCYWTPAERQSQWHFNTRIDYCPAGQSCQFFIQIEY